MTRTTRSRRGAPAARTLVGKGWIASAGSLARGALTGPGAPARVVAAGLLLATVATQHHDTAFLRLKTRDRFNLLPNWRFFAPEPGTHDYVFVYRTMNAAGDPSRWRGIDLVAGRSLRQFVWYPARRGEKWAFDLVSELLAVADQGLSAVTRLPAYRLLESYVASRIRAEGVAGEASGFQLAVVKSAGYDRGESPEILLVSPRTALPPDAAERENGPA